MEEYFQVRPKNKPKVYGLVVKLCGGKLENLTGDESFLEQYGCQMDRQGNFFVGDNFFFSSISKEDAEKLQEDETNWTKMQFWAATDPFSQQIKAKQDYNDTKR